ncbi:MAG: RagB/SusD family nutrient uptake outer membrane protein [Bacteroides sp.]|nr:RagB/SusD family nutrient uptake outer membrane protein [Bacteroides sp.]
MKKNIYLTAVAIIILSSCTNDLNVEPLDTTVSTASTVYSDVTGYEKALFKIYSVWALSGQDGAGSSDISDLDAGNTVLFRSWFTLQEQCTDEMKNSWSDPWCLDVNGITWGTTKNEPVEGVYQRCMYIVALVNEYLRNIPHAPKEVDKNGSAAEARFCRALAYYTLMDMFGIPPFITEDNYSINPGQLSRADLFAWLEGELQEIRTSLPAGGQGEYGRANQAAIDALLARMYLNAQVYTGVERYSDCIEACNRIMTGSYQLAEDYAELFMADNGQNTRARREIIFPICFDGEVTQSYGMAAVILGSRGSGEFAEVPAGISGGWDGYRGTPELVRLFDFINNDSPQANRILDRRGIFFDKNRSIGITTSVTGTFTTEGWAVYKYTNMRSDGQPGSNTTFPDTDFPMFRLGDVYLMYAEAVARGGQGGNLKTAVDCINALRKRAYGDDSHQITEAWLYENNYRNILDERGRELYWEGVRRTDLIRFGLFTSSDYLWTFKGGVLSGIGVDTRYNVFPIPSTDMSVNVNLIQNVGY